MNVDYFNSGAPAGRTLALLLTAGLLVVSCGDPETYGTSPPSDEFRAEQERLLAEAQQALEADPGDVEAAIWAGRRTAYLGRYRDAIAIYDEAIARHPGDARLYRHRGHRYITLREFERAIEDLEHAAQLRRGLDDRIEPDGLPNERNLPRTTLHSNIGYHLGLAHFLRGEYEAAERVFGECVRSSTNPDTLVSASYWLVLALRRQGREDEARALLEPIHADLDVIENHAYRDLLLLFRGERDPEALLDAAERDGGVTFPTVAYGVGSHWLARGERERAVATYRRAVRAGPWAAFGAIAAEAELARLYPPAPPETLDGDSS